MIDGIHDDHVVGPVILQKAGTYDLLTCTGHKSPRLIGVDVHGIGDVVQTQVERCQKGDALRTAAPENDFSSGSAFIADQLSLG